MSPSPPEYAVPTAPTWNGDPVTYGAALDSWLADLHQLCADRRWYEWYMAMWGDRPPPPVALEPYPQRGDTAGWARWWQQWRDAYRAAGASADGINDSPPPAPDPARRRRRRRSRDRRRVEAIVRNLLAKELPEAIAVLLERRAGQ
jgi:hypothetical protein